MRRRGGGGEDGDADRSARPSSARKQVESVFKSLDIYSNKKIAAEFTKAPSGASSNITTIGYLSLIHI